MKEERRARTSWSEVRAGRCRFVASRSVGVILITVVIISAAARRQPPLPLSAATDAGGGGAPRLPRRRERRSPALGGASALPEILAEERGERGVSLPTDLRRGIGEERDQPLRVR